MTGHTETSRQQLANKASFDEESLILLLRSLSTRRTLAFLGSGISLPYGSVSWSLMERRLRHLALSAIEAHIEHQDAGEHRLLDPLLDDRLRRLKARINEIGEAPDRLSPEQNLTRFELYRLAFDLSREAQASAGASPDGFEDHTSDFHVAIATLMRNDLVVAEINAYRRLNMLQQGLVSPEKGVCGANVLNEAYCAALHHDRDGKQKPASNQSESDSTTSFDFQAFYSLQTIQMLTNGIAAAETEIERDNPDAKTDSLTIFLREVQDAVRADAERASKDVDEGGLPPDRRSFFSLVFASIIARAATSELHDQALKKYLLPLLNLGTHRKKPPTSACSRLFISDTARNLSESTSQALRPRSDPIESLVKKLSMWRFLSTNYDFEVERYLEHLNYPRGTLSIRRDIVGKPFAEDMDPITGRRYSRSFLGESASSDVLSAESVGDLIDISTRSQDVGARVMHLHGRADMPETIIATETDYQNLYLRQRADRQSLDNAFQIVFSGNPVLFIGSGMTEQDLLRPLREFVSNQPIDGRELFALMPANSNAFGCDALKMECFLRYGVRVIFYGEPQNQNKPPEDGADIDFEAPQLAPLKFGLASIGQQILELKENLKIIQDFVKNLGTPETGENTAQFESAVNYILQSNGKCSDSDESDENSGVSGFALDIVFGDENLRPQFVIDRLLLERTISDLRRRMLAWGARKNAPKSGRVQKAFFKRIPRLKLHAILELMIDYLEQLNGKIMSATLVRALADLESMQLNWWRDVGRPAPARLTPSGHRWVNTSGRETELTARQPMIWPGTAESFHTANIQKLVKILSAPAAAKNLWAKSTERARGRLLFCYSETGIGKGSFYHGLTEALYQGARVTRPPSAFTHHWFANLSHSLEFSSVLVGIGNFLRRLVIDARMAVSSDLDEIRDTQGHLQFIEALIDRICDPANKAINGKRGVLVMAGFDRLISGDEVCRTVEIEATCRQLARLVWKGSLVDVVIISSRRRNVTDIFRSSDLTDTEAVASTDELFQPLESEYLRSLPKRVPTLEARPGRGIAVCLNIEPAAEAEPAARAQNGAVDEETRTRKELDREIGHSVFIRHLVSEILSKDNVWDRRDKPHPETARSRKIAWMKSLAYALQTSSQENMPSRVIAAVLDQYGLQATNSDGKIDYASRIDFLVLKTLACFGFPTEGLVLLRTPEIKTYLRYHAKHHSEHSAGTRSKSSGTASAQVPAELDQHAASNIDIAVHELQASLTRLLGRRLIGAIEARSRARRPGETAKLLDPTDDHPAFANQHDIKEIASLRNGRRFVLHPHMKRYITANFAYRAPETGFTNTFVLSIFAAQPTDVALLSSDVQIKIDELIEELIQAWRAYPIMSIRELLRERPIEGSDQLKAAASKSQMNSLFDAARGRSAPGAPPAPTGLPADYLFRAKTARGLLARASADMPACFRAAYGILRQLRPFSVLVRMEIGDRTALKGQPLSPFDQTERRLKRLLEGVISAQQAREVAKGLADPETPEYQRPETFDGQINDVFDRGVYESDEVKKRSSLMHPINTFGPLDEPEEALYPHEIAWLWNERGVIAFAQGKLYDALPYFHQARRAMHRHEGSPSPRGPGTARIDLNIAIADIERGNLRRARKTLNAVSEYCREAFDPEVDLTDPRISREQIKRRHIIRPVATGYQGLIDHLSGDLENAIEKYSKAIDTMALQNRGRVISIFRKHRADAYFALNSPEAEREIALSISSAQAMIQLDQLHFARLSQVQQLLRKNTVEAQNQTGSIIKGVVEYATAMSLSRLLCEALFYDARLKANQQQYDLACKSASESIAIATKNGMKLRRITASILLGEIYCRIGDERTGRKLLEDAAEAAQKIGYQLAVEAKQKTMYALGFE